MGNEIILVDIGSSTVKMYLANENQILLKKIENIFFNVEFSPDGLSPDNEKKLVEFLLNLKKDYPSVPIFIYATAVFRKLNVEARKKLSDKIYEKTELIFNLISHEMENFYLEQALLDNFDLKEPVLLINVGGGSTEFVVVNNKKSIERKNIDIGVGALLKKFPEVNNELSSIDKKIIIDFIEPELPDIENKPSKAFYTGGELSYMQLANYPLKKNIFFNDSAHPSVISFEDFSIKNDEVFSKIKLSELEKLMPDSPKWMHGARVCSAFVEAICKKYNIGHIIPSDSNLIDGIFAHQFKDKALRLSGE
ncbi:MAG: hypothetical protein WC548_00385 [Candidatus Pacearchaeota archaeon]